MDRKLNKKEQFKLFEKNKTSLTTHRNILIEKGKCKYPDGDCSRCYMVTKVWCVQYLLDNKIITDKEPEIPVTEPIEDIPEGQRLKTKPTPEPTPEPPKPEPTPEPPTPEPTPEPPTPEPTPEPVKPEPTPEPTKPETDATKKSEDSVEIGAIGRIVKWNNS